MKPGTDSALFLSTLCPFAKADRAVCNAELCGYATRIQESARLIELGARAGLVAQLTGLEKTTVNRLYRQLHGEPSPPGQMPFTDTWYRAHDRRMLQATLVWRLQHRMLQTGRSAARSLIDAYEAYERLIGEPLFDLTRVVHVPRLVNMEPGMSDPVRTVGRPSWRPWTVRNVLVLVVGCTTGIAVAIVASSCRSNPEAAGGKPVPSVASINIGGGCADHARIDPHVGDLLALRVTITRAAKAVSARPP